jgi:hypothetical protein
MFAYIRSHVCNVCNNFETNWEGRFYRPWASRQAVKASREVYSGV